MDDRAAFYEQALAKAVAGKRKMSWAWNRLHFACKYLLPCPRGPIQLLWCPAGWYCALRVAISFAYECMCFVLQSPVILVAPAQAPARRAWLLNRAQQLLEQAREMLPRLEPWLPALEMDTARREVQEGEEALADAHRGEHH